MDEEVGVSVAGITSGTLNGNPHSKSSGMGSNVKHFHPPASFFVLNAVVPLSWFAIFYFVLSSYTSLSLWGEGSVKNDEDHARLTSGLGVPLYASDAYPSRLNL